ncbi:MAG TPA: T9SS type A sorting domain-containing protein, partial [Bacteroidia bacterium]|nr:T9SS type A sorting domain-containing protein [Bacteroidia bacterium]
YPNPSYSATSIDYVIPEFGNVKLTVTDLLGQTIAVLADGNEGAGLHTVSINTNDLAAGMYIYTLNYNGEQITKRMIVTK